MQIDLNINADTSLRLTILSEKVERFSPCRLELINIHFRVSLCKEDYLYVFVENIYKRLQNLHSIDEIPDMQGVIGKWQEYYYYDKQFVCNHQKQIFCMENTTLLSTELYGLFLYKYKGKVWIEIDKGYEESEIFITPKEYYDSFKNYRVVWELVSDDRISEWMTKIDDIVSSVVL